MAQRVEMLILTISLKIRGCGRTSLKTPVSIIFRIQLVFSLKRLQHKSECEALSELYLSNILLNPTLFQPPLANTTYFRYPTSTISSTEQSSR